MPVLSVPNPDCRVGTGRNNAKWELRQDEFQAQTGTLGSLHAMREALSTVNRPLSPLRHDPQPLFTMPSHASRREHGCGRYVPLRDAPRRKTPEADRENCLLRALFQTGSRNSAGLFRAVRERRISTSCRLTCRSTSGRRTPGRDGQQRLLPPVSDRCGDRKPSCCRSRRRSSAHRRSS